MKKALFTIQMVALIAIFPVYLVVELNQQTGTYQAPDRGSIKEKAGNRSTAETGWLDHALVSTFQKTEAVN